MTQLIGYIFILVLLLWGLWESLCAYHRKIKAIQKEYKKLKGIEEELKDFWTNLEDKK